MRNVLSPVSVEIPKKKEVVFPKLCPRCLKPAGPTVEVRSVRHLGPGIHVTKVSVPICKDCWREIMPKHLFLILVFGWGLVASGVFLGVTLQNGLGVALFFLCLFASRIIRDRNPLGVYFRETKAGYVWSFPNPIYAELFAHLNLGQVLASSPTSQGMSR